MTKYWGRVRKPLRCAQDDKSLKGPSNKSNQFTKAICPCQKAARFPAASSTVTWHWYSPAVRPPNGTVSDSGVMPRREVGMGVLAIPWLW